MIGRERHPELRTANSPSPKQYSGQRSYDQENTYIREYVSHQESVTGIISTDIGGLSQSYFHFSPHELNFTESNDECD